MKTTAFVKQLASNKRAVRENALSTLKKFLSSREKSKPLSLLELKKLWKGLYFTMWFSDRPLPQQRLANDLASLFSDCVVDDQFLNLVEAFWTIMGLEWRELDKWRVDKYLMLMRYVVRECFVRLANEGWKEKSVAEYLAVLDRTVLSINGRYPVALTYHVVDVWVDELMRALFGELEKRPEPETDEVVGESDLEEEETEEEREERITRRVAIIKETNVPIDTLLNVFRAKFSKTTTKALKEKMVLEVFEAEALAELGVDVSYPQEKIPVEMVGDSEEEQDAECEDDNEVEEEEEEDEEEETEEPEEEEWTGFGST